MQLLISSKTNTTAKLSDYDMKKVCDEKKS